MKISKNIINTFAIFGVLAASFSLNACSEFSFGGSFLDQQPDNTGVNAESMFTNKTYANQVLTKAYSQLLYPINWGSSGYDRMYGDLSDVITDMAHSNTSYSGGSKYYTGSYSAATVSQQCNHYFLNSKIWTAIRFSWLVVENIDKVPDMTSEEKSRAKAEAKMIIATHYADMFRHYGGVPILDHAISTADELKFPRNTAKQTLDFIIKLIDEATPDLEWRVSDVNDDGRMTAGYAKALKLRTLLFAASPLFNSNEAYHPEADSYTWFGSEDASLWREAADAGREFFSTNNGEYALNAATSTDVTAYRKAFRDAYFTRNNPEMILSLRRTYANTYTNSFCGGSDNFASAQHPSLKMFELYPMADGSDFDFDWSTPGGVNPYAGRDPRFYETILDVNSAYKGRLSQLWVGGLDRTSASSSTGFRMYKFSQDYTSTTSIGHVDCYPGMRLSEVMLSYAEALNECGIDRSIASEMVYNVRARVGITSPTAAQIAELSQAELRDFILDERAREFGFEDVRWFDIVRWKKQECFTTPIKGLNMYRDSDSTTPDGTYRYETYSLEGATLRAWANNWDAKWYLSAFPAAEVNKNYGLVQNPGW